MAGGFLVYIFLEVNMKINVLGSEWNIEYRNPEMDPKLMENNAGYTDPTVQMIVVANRTQQDDISDYERAKRLYTRHEIIHAFLFESGLGANFEHPGYGHEETVVDWFAIQFPKIKKAFEEAGCL